MTINEKCKGVVVPMVTPFTEQEEIDRDAAGRITEYLIRNGCIPFILGTSGEATSQSVEQKRALTESVVEVSAGRVPVYAGIASICYRDSVRLANDFFTMGVNFAVAHLPFFYPLTPLQMKEYFLRLADAIDGPLMIYNIPATTGMSIPAEIVFELSEHDNIVGVKDSERSLEKQNIIIAFCKENPRFSHFSGWGAQIAHALSLGSDGLVPSTGNLVAGHYRDLYRAAVDGDTDTANRLQQETDAISAVYQKERTLGESLAALKVMMNEWGLCGKTMQSPLTRLRPEEENQVIDNMKRLELIRQTERTSNTD